MKIINKKPFYIGILILVAEIFVNLVPKSSAQSGNMSDDWYGQIIILALAIFLVSYGLYPNSPLGRIGEKIYNLYHWVLKQNKK